MTTQLNTASYYRNRERQERSLASSSKSVAIAEIHLELAERYAGLIEEAVKAEGVEARLHVASFAAPHEHRRPSLQAVRPRLKLAI